MENKSGISPLGFAVLLQPYEPELRSSIIEIPESAKGRLTLVEQRATVIEVGPEAWRNEAVPRAQPGDKVLVTKYAGYMAVGVNDGAQYRLVNDLDIFARIEAE